MSQTDKVLKALANPRRIAILKYLERRRRASVGDIADNIRLSLKATSKHLALLLNAEILEKQQEGLTMWHSFSGNKHPVVVAALKHS